MEVGVVVRARRDLAFVWRIHCDSDLLAGSPQALVPPKSIGGQTLRRSSLNVTAWLSFGVAAISVRFLRASAKRRVILMTEVMAMTPALVEKEPGGCWEEPWLVPRLETVRVYQLWPRSVGDLEAKGVWNSVDRTGRDLGRSEPGTQTLGTNANGFEMSVGFGLVWLDTRKQMASGPWLVGASS